MHIELNHGTIKNMISKYHKHKNEAIHLRKRGMTYGQIRKSLGVLIPKSTLSCWFRDMVINKRYEFIHKQNVAGMASKGLMAARIANRHKRYVYLASIEQGVRDLGRIAKDRNVAKIALAMLYLGEGRKSKRCCLMFGNSSATVVRLFLRYLRYCYSLDESKFRCTLQCRAGQDITSLEKYWSEITGIPLNQFYGARIDPRTIGKKIKKPDYKGVCRIDYFSSEILIELSKIVEILNKTGL